MSGAGPLGRELRERGFVVLKRLLPEPVVDAYVAELERLSGRPRASFAKAGGGLFPGYSLYRAWTLPDGVTKTRAFWDLILAPQLLSAMRELLGPNVRFLQHTDLHVGFSAVNWHRDSVDRRLGRDGDWDERAEPYALARVGFYLQSHAESRFALGLVPGSHRRGGMLADAALEALERRTEPWLQAAALVARRDPLEGRAEWVAAERGDAIVFDPRILHSGKLSSGPKFSVFLAYGLPGRHFARHQHYYRHVRRELGYAEPEPELAARLAAAGLLADPAASAGVVTDSAYRPGLLERLVGRHVRPKLAR